MDSVSIRAPYRNLKKEVEVEMVGVEDQHHHLIQLDNSPSSSSPNSASHIPNGDSSFSVRSKTNGHFSLITLILSCTVAASVQFGWALQLSLLTPYIQASQILRPIVCKPCIRVPFFLINCKSFDNITRIQVRNMRA